MGEIRLTRGVINDDLLFSVYYCLQNSLFSGSIDATLTGKKDKRKTENHE